MYAANARLFDWRGLKRLQLHFAHQPVYPAWLASFVNEDHFKAIQPDPNRLLVATWDCRPGTTVEDAFVLGQKDARRALADGQIQLSV